MLVFHAKHQSAAANIPITHSRHTFIHNETDPHTHIPRKCSLFFDCSNHLLHVILIQNKDTKHIWMNRRTKQQEVGKDPSRTHTHVHSYLFSSSTYIVRLKIRMEITQVRKGCRQDAWRCERRAIEQTANAFDHLLCGVHIY